MVLIYSCIMHFFLKFVRLKIFNCKKQILTFKNTLKQNILSKKLNPWVYTSTPASKAISYIYFYFACYNLSYQHCIRIPVSTPFLSLCIVKNVMFPKIVSESSILLVWFAFCTLCVAYLLYAYCHLYFLV